ncbi:type II toxin-antitoxin system PemK/MazF family toxin [Xanthobacter autotrophicus]|uniref:type II toxin-antitoxin system PemK/MazF family toxin n=1 Tax=Xanthobacter autotrophicus TaxID=280 RepID=UPI003729D163
MRLRTRPRAAMTLAAGDIVWAEFDPVRGSEQAGRRPALVVSMEPYNTVSRRAFVCPITSRLREWPYNVPLPEGTKTRGMVLVDQMRAVDQAARIFGLIERAPEGLLAEVRGRLLTLLGISLAS